MIGLEVPRAAGHPHRRSSRGASAAFGGRAQHAHRSRDPGAAGHAAGAQPRARSTWRCALGLALGLQHPAAVPASRASTTSTRIFPRAFRSRSTTSRWARAARSSFRLRRRGRARCASRASTWRRTRARTSTPPARRSASSTTTAPGVPLCEVVSEPDLRSAEEAAEYLRALRQLVRYLGDLRRQHGGGLAPLRRQRVAAPARRDQARHQGRAQEHQLVQERRGRDRVRDRAAGGAARSRRAGRAGDAAVGRRRAACRARCARRSRRTTTATSPSRICRRSSVDEAALAERAAALPELPEARFARYAGAVGLSPRTPACWSSEQARSPTTTTPRSRRAGRARAQAGRQLGDQRGARARGRIRATSRRRRCPCRRRRWPSSSASSRRAPSRASMARTCSGACGTRSARPPTS